MSQMHRAVIPYESIDPLTIGAAENDELVYRDTLELDIPQANLLAEIRPDEPEAVRRRDRGRRARARASALRARASASCSRPPTASRS